MPTIKFNRFSPRYWMLVRKNRKIRYQTEYKRLLQECDGDVITTELIMAIMKIEPGYNRKTLLPDERPEFKLIKFNTS
jgi:hypothetical protein